MKTLSGKADEVGKEGLERLSRFRWELRRFLRFSEDACRAHGVSMLQYQLLLHTQGFPDREWASIGELADRLQAKPHGVVALVDRCEEAGLVQRRPDPGDRRMVQVHVTAKGRRLLVRIAVEHAEELRDLARVVSAASEDSA